MKKLVITILIVSFGSSFAQEHFGAFSTSTRVGLLNANINPSELVNTKRRVEVQLFSASINASNNKIGFSDIVRGENIEAKLFDGGTPVSFNVDAEVLGPGVAARIAGWGFAIQTKAYAKVNAVDVDGSLGKALADGNLGSILSRTDVNSPKNQRLNGASWGEVGFSVAREIFDTESHKLSGGVNFKLLFPGAYANIGLDQFRGTITNVGTTAYLSDATAGINIAFSNSLANSTAQAQNFTQNIFGNLNGLATDIGVNYMLKSALTAYKLKVGASVRNIGSMTFKGDNNQSTNYALNIPRATTGSLGLDLGQFDGTESPQEIENILFDRGYLSGGNESSDVVVKLPTVLNLYADVQILPKLNVSAFMQQKLNDNNQNDQINAQNSFSLTPRFSIKFFEVATPIVFNEISGTTAGLGLRIGGFFVGSNSVLSAITADSMQADAYFGFRFGFL